MTPEEEGLYRAGLQREPDAHREHPCRAQSLLLGAVAMGRRVWKCARERASHSQTCTPSQGLTEASARTLTPSCNGERLR